MLTITKTAAPAEPTTSTTKRSRKKKAPVEQPAEQPPVTQTEPQVVTESNAFQPVGQTEVEEPKIEEPEPETITIQLENVRVVTTIVGTVPGSGASKWLDASKLLSYDVEKGTVTMTREWALKQKLVAA